MADDLNDILRDLTEELKDLVRTLSSTGKTILKGTKNQKTYNNVLEATKRHLNDYDKSIKGTTSAQKKQKKEIQGNISELDKFNKSTKKASTGLGKFFDDLSDIGRTTKLKDIPMQILKGIKDTGSNFVSAGVKVDSFQKALSGFDGLSLLGMQISDLGAIVDFNQGIYKQLAHSGATFGKSVISLREAARGANMPILKFTDLIGQNSEMLGKLFGNVDNSIASVQEFAKNLRTRTMSELAEFGFNLDETSEFLTTLMETERARGNAEKMSSMDMVGATINYTKNLIRLSKLTGVSVKELDKQSLALSANGAFQVQINKLGIEEANRIQALTSSLTSIHPAMGQFMQEIIGLGVPISETSRFLSVMGGGVLEDSIKAFQSGQLSLEEFTNRVRIAANDALQNGEAFGDLALIGGGSGDALNVLTALAGKTSSGLEDQMNVQGDNTDALIRASDQLDILKTKAEIAGTILVDTALNFDKKIEGLLNFLGDPGSATDMIGDSLKGMWTGVMEKGSHLWVKFKDGSEEYMFKGKDGKNFIDNITPWDTLNEKLIKRGQAEATKPTSPANQYAFGTNGFQDFGAGTAATLHGSEAVVPENSMFGNALSMLGQLTKRTHIERPGPALDNEMRTARNSTDLLTLNSTATRIADSSQKVESALNTLIRVSAMTEKNTKGTKNSLVDLRGSLV